MSDPVDPKTLLTLVEMSIDNTYELAALGELLEQKGGHDQGGNYYARERIETEDSSNRIPYRFHTRPITTTLHRHRQRRH